MSPDLNTLPPSPHGSTAAIATAPAAPSPPSLAATAALNAGIHSQDARRSSSGSLSMQRSAEHARRRSSIRLRLALNDPGLPAAGELHTHSPRHEHAPSLGELHQTLEYEQEGQVNRLLTMIRHEQHHMAGVSPADDTTTTTTSSPHHHPSDPLSTTATAAAASPAPAPAPASSPSRDEAAFYHAETQNLTRENQMLKLRIRELGTLLMEPNPMQSN